MASFNKVILMGNMTADPELKQTPSGVSVCSFSIAVNRRFKSEDGQQNVDFINIVAWRQSAEFVDRYFKKGTPILVCGQIQTRNYTDNQGQKRYVTEVVADEVSFVESKGESKSAEPTVSTPPNPASFGNKSHIPSAYMGNNKSQFEDIPNDESLPF